MPRLDETAESESAARGRAGDEPARPGMARRPGRLLRPTALALALTTALPAFGQEERVSELEGRVAELEALLRQMTSSDPADPSAPSTVDTADADARAEEVAERRVQELLAEARAAQEEEARKHSLTFGGYVKLDALYSDFSGGSVPSDSVGRDFYVPATVPVGGDGERYLDFHAKETRIYVNSEHRFDGGDYLRAYIEMDFLVGDQGDERISNSYNPRMRHAYLVWNNWLFGQTWHTIFNVSALPDLLDFVGPSESTVFGRQPMVRYTRGPWQLALENPESTITPFGGGTRIVADDSTLPDFVARYNSRSDWGEWSLAGILRELRYDNSADGIDTSTASYGLSLAGRFNVGERDDLRWMISGGKGLGRYVGLNIVTGGVLDGGGELETIDTLSGFVAYRHYWVETLRSSLVLSYFGADNPTGLTGDEVTSRAESYHANLIWTPMPKLDLGAELIYASREIESGEDGDLTRLQLSAKLAF